MFNLDAREMANAYNLAQCLPVELKILILQLSGHLRLGTKSMCWFLWP